MKPSDSLRFWSHVDRSGGPDACWPWTASRDAKGYGWFFLERRNLHAPRALLALQLGFIPPPSILACHTCDNPPCVNPAHIYAGDAQTNVDDMHARGRTRAVPGAWKRPDTTRLHVRDIHERGLETTQRVSEGISDWRVMDARAAADGMIRLSPRLDHGEGLPEWLA
jgi:hypothetical protein